MADGFEAEEVATGLNQPTAMDIGPSGEIYVAEKRGTVQRIDPDGSVHQVLDISAQVNTYVDRGLVGIAVDSDFENHPYVYVVYTLDRGTVFESDPTVGRLVRYEVAPDGRLVSPRTILGTASPAGCPPPSDTSDCLPAEGSSHTPDLVRSAPDGTLFLSAGEAETDLIRALDERSLAGKVIRVDRDGHGVEGHPFCPERANLTDVCTKIFAMGFRNPWRIALHPDGERVIVGDVGQVSVEEINLAGPGDSFGWPCYEGLGRYGVFSQTCTQAGVYDREGTPEAELSPWWHYEHGTGGASIVGGPLYRGTSFPEGYRDALLVADTVRGWVRAVTTEPDGSAGELTELGSGFAYPVHLQMSLDGEDLYVVELVGSRIQRIRHTEGNRRPRASASASPTSGSEVPMTVSFEGGESSDPDGDELDFEWDFGDGSPPSPDPAPTHDYLEAGTYTAALTVTDPEGLADTDTVRIVVGNEAPEASIEEPDEDLRYVAGESVALRGHAVDSEDGPLPDSALRWEVELQHNDHVHRFQDLEGGNATLLTTDDHDADSHYRVRLVAVDSAGIEGSATVEIHPQTVELALTSDPPGAELSYAGRDVIAPHTRTAGVGFDAPISAAATLEVDGETLEFSHWQHGGPRSQTFRIPEEDTTLTAVYRPPEPDLITQILDLIRELLGALG